MARLNKEMHILLTQNVLELLFSKKIYTILDFIKSDIKQLSSITHLPLKDVVAIKDYLVNKNAAVTRNGLHYYRDLLEKTALIKTGIKNLDELLEGGLMTGKIYEICGPPSSGKTQLCLTLCKNIAEKATYNIFYLDTKRDFSAKRLGQMLAENIDKPITETLSKILVQHVTTKHSLLNTLYHLQNRLTSGFPCRLVILDSLPALLTSEDKYNVDNNIFLNHAACAMQYLAAECHVAVVVTNLWLSWSEGGFEERKVVERVGCGKYWLGVPHNRLKLEGKGGECRVRLVKSCEFEVVRGCCVVIGDDGVG